MKTQFKAVLQILVCCLVLVGCKDEAKGQGGDSSTEVSTVCKNLNKQGDKDYRLLSGRVLDAEVLVDSGDGGPEATKQKKAMFSALIKSDEGDITDFRIFTNQEPAVNFENRPSYMIVGQHYQFCAKDAPLSQRKEDMPWYIIDAVETIKEME